MGRGAVSIHGCRQLHQEDVICIASHSDSPSRQITSFKRFVGCCRLASSLPRHRRSGTASQLAPPSAWRNWDRVGIESIHAELNVCPLRQELVRGLGGAELPCRHLLLEEFFKLRVATSFELEFQSAIGV
jgi:hypothetical protein